MTATVTTLAAKTLVWAAIGTWACLGAHASYTDLRTATISRRACWTVGAAITALLGGAAALAGEPFRWMWTLVGAAPVALSADIGWQHSHGRLGYGDVRLIAVNSLLTAWWGPQWPWWALLAGAVTAWPAAIASAVRRGRGAHIRWAPWLSCGTAGVVAWGLHSTGPGP